jgi:Na+-driven multidrug efflux pump
MADGTKRYRRALWIFLTVGAIVGLCLGILVSLTTDVPFAPEIGIFIGLAAGWSVRMLRA